MLAARLATLCFGFLAGAQFTSFNDFWPGARPLALRSPYLNTWIISTINIGPLNLNLSPRHWNNSVNFVNMGWYGAVRVDGQTFAWLGDVKTSGGGTNNTLVEEALITPTRTSYIIPAGNVSLNITFLSPVEPHDLVKQSFPFVYLYVTVTPTDGLAHRVQLYTDVTTEWISGDRASMAIWNTTTTANSVYHQASRSQISPMNEIQSVAEDATVYYAMKQSPALSWQTGADIDVRRQFAASGKLGDFEDSRFRTIEDTPVVLGIANDLGTITGPSVEAVWGLGLVRNPVIQYSLNDGVQNRASYFWTAYDHISDAIDDFMKDFPNALRRSTALDVRIVNDAKAKISQNYSDLASMATRQTMAGFDITVGVGSDGSLDRDDVKAFMKDMGLSRRTNPMEAIYAASPALLYLNPDFLFYLLDPLLQYQASSVYTNNFAAPDLGTTYPIALGNNSVTTPSPIDDTAGVLIMTWAHARYSGNGVLISNYYDLLKKYADYLVNNTLAPGFQTVDTVHRSNITNLALKGIIGIQAMSDISKTFGNDQDSNHYSTIAKSYISQWTTLADSTGHLIATYDSTASYGLIYNLYVEKLLSSGLIPDTLYESQSAYYKSLLSGSAPALGIQVDNTISLVMSQWLLFTAATTDADVMNTFVGRVRTRANFNDSSQLGTLGSFPTTYDASSGRTIGGQASSAQGAMFAPLALDLKPNASISIPPPSSTPSISNGTYGGGNNSGKAKRLSPRVIAPIVIGVLLVLVLAPLLFVIIKKKAQIILQTELASAAVQSPFVTSSLNDNLLVTTVSGKLNEPSSSSSDGSGRNPQMDTLTREVTNLRRELEELRAQREMDDVPPPEYE